MSLQKTNQASGLEAYASWRLDGRHKGHNIHGGIIQSSEGIGAITLDDYCLRKDINSIALIKIDIDGHELEVLKGAQSSILNYRHLIIFELGLYLMKEAGIGFLDYSAFFDSINYKLFHSIKMKEINIYNYHKFIPARGTIDILAVP